MYRLFEGAHAVVFLFDTSAECYWRAYRGALDATKIYIIPNGYDGEIEKFNTSSDKKCVFLYTGTLSTYHYDVLLQSLQALKDTDPAYAGLMRFLFVGEGMTTLAKQAAGRGLSDIVHTVGPSPQSEISRLQQEAHALLILGRHRDDKGHELLAGAKLFSYLKTGRPIVGILPHDETRKVLSRVRVSTVADSDSPAEIIAILRQVLTAWSEGTLSSLIPDPTACAAYSAERQTATLVRALDGAPALEPFMPGVVEVPPSLREEIGGGGWGEGQVLGKLRLPANA
jgi:glycosyltransferase involved in cell wall biosynthesis